MTGTTGYGYHHVIATRCNVFGQCSCLLRLTSLQVPKPQGRHSTAIYSGWQHFQDTQYTTMGFLKRLFSIGNKNQKNSKKSPTKSKSLSPEVEEEDHEVIAGRLLRSSSTRFGVVAEVDYSTLPPLRTCDPPFMRPHLILISSPSHQQCYPNSRFFFRQCC